VAAPLGVRLSIQTQGVERGLGSLIVRAQAEKLFENSYAFLGRFGQGCIPEKSLFMFRVILQEGGK